MSGVRAGRATGTRVTKRRGETRARLLDAAMDVLVDRGFGRTTIGDVCSAAGYTRGAFYSQFDTLDELFFALYDQRAALITQQLAEALGTAPSGATAEEQVGRAVGTVLLDRSWILVKTDFLLHAARHPAAAGRLVAHRDALRLAVADRLEESGTVLPGLADVGGAAAAVIACYDAAAAALLLDGDEARARSWFAELLTALLRGDGT